MLDRRSGRQGQASAAVRSHIRPPSAYTSSCVSLRRIQISHSMHDGTDMRGCRHEDVIGYGPYFRPWGPSYSVRFPSLLLPRMEALPGGLAT